MGGGLCYAVVCCGSNDTRRGERTNSGQGTENYPGESKWVKKLSFHLLDERSERKDKRDGETIEKDC